MTCRSFILCTRFRAMLLACLALIAGVSVSSANVLWEPLGIGGGGAFTMVAFDPVDPNIQFTGSNVGGPYRSTDGGASWVAITDGITGLGDKYRNPSGGIIFDPRDHQVIYKGARLLFKSIDGGDHWSVIRDEISYRIALDRARPDILYVSGKPKYLTERTCERSTNGGVDWQPLSTGLPEAVTIFALEVDTLTADVYACTDKGVFRNPGGVSDWIDISEGLPVDDLVAIYWENNTGGQQGIYPMALHRNPIDGLTLFVVADSLYKRTESDTAWWKPVNENYGGWGIAPYQTIVVHPDDPNRLFLGGLAGLRRSTNGGDRWMWTDIVDEDGWLGQVQCSGGAWGGESVQAIAYAESDPTQMLLSAIFVLKSTDTGATWHQIYTNESPPGSGSWTTTGIDPVYALSVAFDPTDPDVLHGGYADIGYLLSEDSGASYRRTCDGMSLSSVGEDVNVVVVDPDDPSIVYAVVHHYFDLPAAEGKCSVIAQSLNGGETWSLVAAPDDILEGTIWSIGLGTESTVGDRRIYAPMTSVAGGDTLITVYVSPDAGASWYERGNGLPDPNPNHDMLHLHAERITVVPGDDDHAYLSVATEYVPLDMDDPDIYGGVWETLDGGLNWNLITPPDLVRSVNDVVVDPTDHQVLYLAANDHVDWYAKEMGEPDWFYPGGVYKSTDGGSTWVMLMEDHLIFDLEIAPFDHNLIYAASRDWTAWWQEREDMVYPGGIELASGVYRSPDGGQTWTLENEGLGQLDLWTLACDPNRPGTIYCGTRGGGLYRGDDSDITGAVELESLTSVAPWLSVPTPCSPSSRIRFGLRSGKSVSGSLILYDVIGRKVKSLWEGKLTTGILSVGWDGRDAQGRIAASGIYLAKLSADHVKATRRLVWIP